MINENIYKDIVYVLLEVEWRIKGARTWGCRKLWCSLGYYSGTIYAFNGIKDIHGHMRSVIAKYKYAIRNVDVEGIEECELSLQEGGG